MKDIDRFIQERQKLLQTRIDEIRKNLVELNPELLARNCRSTFIREGARQGYFELSYWQDIITISYPGFTAIRKNGQELAAVHQALLMYHLATSDGTMICDSWISFSELPGGSFYERAFQGYTGAELARGFKNDLSLFTTCAVRAGGIPNDFGDTSFLFKILPSVSILVVGWRGDEDFPTSFQVLFNSSAAHYLPTDAYAIAGSILTQKILSLVSQK